MFKTTTPHPTAVTRIGSIECVDNEVANLLKEYVSQIDQHPRNPTSNSAGDFRSSGMDLFDKVDEACWVWAQNPETRSKAIRLRSLSFMHLFEDVVLDENIVERDFMLPFDSNVKHDSFWGDVDKTLYGFIHNYNVHGALEGVDFEPSTQPDAAHEQLCLLAHRDQPSYSLERIVSHDDEQQPHGVTYRVARLIGQAAISPDQA